MKRKLVKVPALGGNIVVRDTKRGRKLVAKIVDEAADALLRGMVAYDKRNKRGQSQ